MKVNDLASILKTIDGLIPDSRAGLPEAAFLFISTLTPLVNVDLCIQDDAGRRERGHSIALLYRCRLLAPLSEARRASSSPPRPHQWAWHEGRPQNLIREHRVCQRFFHE